MKCPSTNEWIKNTHTHTHGGILFAIKKNEILAFVIIWMGIEGIMLREISQIKKDEHGVILLLRGILKQ